MRDRITLKGMAFYGYHGVLPEEKSLGQRFLVDVTASLDLQPVAHSDDIRDSVDYTAIYRTVKDIIEREKFNLIETLAGRIAAAVLAGFPRIEQVTVMVAKPEAPIPAIIDKVEVEVTRRRSQ